MSMSFINGHNVTAYGAIVVLDRSCGNTPWRKLGWYVMPPGGSALVMTGNQHDLPFTNFAWFACTAADGPSWTGNLWYRIPHNNPFNQCFVMTRDVMHFGLSWPISTAEGGLPWTSS